MPRAKKGYQPRVQLLDMPLPFTGYDTSFARATQRPGTTPTAINVRGFSTVSGRRALARRRGTGKFLQNTISGSDGLQELALLVGTGYVSGGQIYIPGSVPNGNIVVGVTGNAGGTLLLIEPPTPGSMDPGTTGTILYTFGPTANGEQVGGIAVDPPHGGPSAFIYVYSWAANGLGGIDGFLTKYTSRAVQVWRKTLYSSSGSGGGDNPGYVAAPVIYGSNVYVIAGVGDNGVTPTAFPGLYRNKTSDGTPTTSNPWIAGDAIYSAGPGSGGVLPGFNYSASQMPPGPVVATDTNGVPYIAIVQVNENSFVGEVSVVFVNLNSGSLTSQPNLLHASGISSPDGHSTVDEMAAFGTDFYASLRYTPSGSSFERDSLRTLAFSPPSGTSIWSSGVLATGVHTWGIVAGTYYAASDIVYEGRSNKVLISGPTFSGALDATTGIATSLPAPISGSRALSASGGYVAGNTGSVNAVFFPDTRTYTFSPSGLLPFIALLENGVGVGTFSGSPLTVTNYQRAVTLLGVAGGTVNVAFDGFWQSTVNGFQALSTTQQVIRSADNLGNLYFADGVNYKYYQPSTNSVLPWVASSGSLPVDTDGNAPRLICTWNGRTVLSGLPLDPQNWFMSAVGDPTNFNYNPSPTVETQAVAGNNSPAGHVGDIITGLVPYNDDVLIMLGDHTIWQMTGDPMAGGRIDRISDITGGAWGNAWCKTPNGGLYVFGSRGSVYFLNFSAVATAEGNQLTRVSQAIDQQLGMLDMSSVVIRMTYDDRWQGLHVFISDLTGAASTHYYYDEGTQSWWTDQFANPLHNPFCALTYDGDLPQDRTVLMGGQDGWLRDWVDAALDDDGVIIESSVLVGPNAFKGGWEYLLNDIQADVDLTGGSVDWSVRAGYSAQVALTAAPLFTGTFGLGRNHSQAIRASGIACYVGLSRAVRELPWAIESLRGKITVYPHTRQRVF